MVRNPGQQIQTFPNSQFGSAQKYIFFKASLYFISNYIPLFNGLDHLLWSNPVIMVQINALKYFLKETSR